MISANRTPNGGIVDVVISADDDKGLEMTVNIEIHRFVQCVLTGDMVFLNSLSLIHSVIIWALTPDY